MGLDQDMVDSAYENAKDTLAEHGWVDELGYEEASRRMREAFEALLKENQLTIDLDSKAGVREARELLQKHLDAFAAEAGIAATAGNASFGGGSATFKVELVAAGAASKDEQAFKTFAHSVGLEPTDLGRTFRVGGEAYTIAGFRPRARKRPIIAKRSDGKGYVFEAERVRIALEAK